ncbi:MAG: TonB-dependent receptor [Bacteroidota bacterium]
MKTLSTFVCVWLLPVLAFAQQGKITGIIKSGSEAVSFANIGIDGTTIGTVANEQGNFEFPALQYGTYTLVISAIGYEKTYKKVQLQSAQQNVTIQVEKQSNSLNEVTVTGTLKEATKLNSSVPIEVYTPKFFLKNVTNNLFDGLSMINGVMPTINCNICNTGDIHINGMEGPYTLVLIDGMPIVSALSTVYGLMGIPNNMIERIEVVKGPASTLYGSEAVAGIINVITKKAGKAPKFSADVFGTSYNEFNGDFAMRYKLGKTNALLSTNYFNQQTKWDKNKDGFTDIVLQNRLSLFNKYEFKRKSNKEAHVALRYFYENRWGGETRWDENWRGSDSIYGESIYTNRIELIGAYELPTTPQLKLAVSYNYHDQNSYYGFTPYFGKQHVGFAQLLYQPKINNRNDLLAGITYRYTHYDDNSPATADALGNNIPSIMHLPGIFIQNEHKFNDVHTLLVGMRYDYFKQHGSIVSPRINYKIQPDKKQTLRLSAGNGFRVVNLFTEDHAALTGARVLEIKSTLKPEQSWNVNVNYTRFITFGKGFINLDASAFYTYFTNRIIADYDTDPNKIIYDNLEGNAISKGLSLNTDVNFNFPLKIATGITLMDVTYTDKNDAGEMITLRQVHAPQVSGTFQISYTFSRIHLTVDYTGQFYGPMRLPVLPNDYRPEYSPWFTLQNIQFTKKVNNQWQVYAGVKNLFNFMPRDPIMRAFDPFDKSVNVNNPNGYTFDPTYNYAPLQGIRLLLGFRYNLQ